MYTRGGPKLALTLVVVITLAHLVGKYLDRQRLRTKPSAWQRAEPEFHFDDRELLPNPSGTPIATPVHPANSTATMPRPAASTEPVRNPGRQRWVQLARLRARMGPGLCADADAASAAQDRLRAQFRALDWGDTARVYVDPRLPLLVDPPLLQELDRAERGRRRG